jgi:hypothetical protein
LKAGASQVLAHAENTSGTIRRIWITINDREPDMLRGLRLDMYWDGAETPAVSVPIGDFFGHALGRMVRFENALFSSPEARSFNCNIPMPFRTGMKIVATNELDRDVAMFFYDVDYTIGDAHGGDVLYFHTHWRREKETTFIEDYAFLPKVEGKGRFLGVIVGVIPRTHVYDTAWWGEGEAKFYLDGDEKLPTLCGTGTEDYIGTAWGQGQYVNQYQGCPVADGETFQFTFYRFHMPDPIYFRKDIRVTMQQIGCWGPGNRKKIREADEPIYYYKEGEGRVACDLSAETGPPENAYGIFEREGDDWSSCAYFYLDRPENGLPPMPPAAERAEGLVRTDAGPARLDA